MIRFSSLCFFFFRWLSRISILVVNEVRFQTKLPVKCVQNAKTLFVLSGWFIVDVNSLQRENTQNIRRLLPSAVHCAEFRHKPTKNGQLKMVGTIKSKTFKLFLAITMSLFLTFAHLMLLRIVDEQNCNSEKKESKRQINCGR